MKPYPQIIILVLMFISIMLHIYLHNKPHRLPHNAISKTGEILLTILLLYCGGFFDCLLTN
jgi:hypothetical protein